MIQDLPAWIELLFILMVMYVIGFFYIANGRPPKVLLALVIWAVLHSTLAFTGFYLPIEGGFPRFILILVPLFFIVIYGLLPPQLNWVLKHRNLQKSTLLHTVRIGVEIVLFYLFIYKMVPELMTFHGRNFDIIAGITAPLIGYLFIKKKLGLTGLLIWNWICLCLVVFILLNGLLSAELPIQQFGFDQPNKAITYFPFVLLPAVIVPVVIYTHVTDIIYIKRMMKASQHK